MVSCTLTGVEADDSFREKSLVLYFHSYNSKGSLLIYSVIGTKYGGSERMPFLSKPSPRL